MFYKGRGEKVKCLGALIFYFALFFQNTVIPVRAQNELSPVNKVDQRSLMDRWNELRRKALQEAGAIRPSREPRKIERGARPELIFRKNEIYFDGKKLGLGESMDVWKKKIPTSPRCFADGMTLCVWDDYGLEVGTDHKNPNKVRFMNIYISIDHSFTLARSANHPDGRPAKPPEDDMPHQTFSGYLEMNGVGIDAETEFWEIPAGSSDNRTLHCGVLDCSHPSGPFGEHVNISLKLDGRNERGHLRGIGVGIVD